MLLEFSVKNFKTFKDRQTLSLIASNYDKDTRENDNIVHEQKFDLRILKSAVIYGANASGKTKFFDALIFMKKFVLTSSKDKQKGDKIKTTPFLFNTETERQPSEFEINFLIKGTIYRYGFEANSEKIISEWLYRKPKTKEVEIFYRNQQNVELHNRLFSKGKTIIKEELLRDNALLLSVAAQFNDKIATEIIDWFRELGIISGLQERGFEGFTLRQADDPNVKCKMLELMKAADLGIKDFKIEMLNLDNLPNDMPKEIQEFIRKKAAEDENDPKVVSDVLTFHKKFDEKNNPAGYATLSMDDDESFGTQKFFALTGPILDCLENGYTLIVDELDSKLHPNLVGEIVSIFNSSIRNPKNAQLIFNTHDTNLLDSKLFRRDQVWFTEKNKYGEVKLYSLSDFKSNEVRKNEPFEENYLKGKYGGTPYLELFESFNLN